MTKHFLLFSPPEQNNKVLRDLMTSSTGGSRDEEEVTCLAAVCLAQASVDHVTLRLARERLLVVLKV